MTETLAIIALGKTNATEKIIRDIIKRIMNGVRCVCFVGGIYHAMVFLERLSPYNLFIQSKDASDSANLRTCLSAIEQEESALTRLNRLCRLSPLLPFSKFLLKTRSDTRGAP